MEKRKISVFDLSKGYYYDYIDDNGNIITCIENATIYLESAGLPLKSKNNKPRYLKFNKSFYKGGK